ncbi:MAG: 50S ribosomal protein L6 [Nanoarchaeota archaeon]|nr:50S ribosomal protein L6 [Nanoarchaeota archaeon]
MKRDILESVEIPEGIEVELDKNKITIKNKDVTLTKQIINLPIKIKDNKIIFEKKNANKNDKKIIKTFLVHMKNMIQGVQEKFTYKLQIASSHFPITVEKNNNLIIIKNFLGERKDRISKILEDVDVKIEGEFITIESNNKESAGQTAANLETATKIRNRDRRRFQDGIYITDKAGKEI